MARYVASKKSKDYLLHKDQNRILVNAGGKLYRFLINERQLLDDDRHYHSIKFNDLDHELSAYFHSLSCSKQEIMVIVDNDGIAALAWDKVLWKHNFQWAYSGCLKLLFIEGPKIIAEYDDVNDSGLCNMSFDIQTGLRTARQMNKHDR
jgi:hypothetical protein